MVPSPLVKKLRIKPGQRLLVLNAPPGYLDSLGDLPEGADISELSEGRYDFVHVFVKDSNELGRLSPSAIAAVERDGLLWISYPKGSSKVETDLNRDILWELMSGTGYRPVAQISIDEVWSALRFRPAELVGK